MGPSGRFIFKGNSHIKLKVISIYPPKGLYPKGDRVGPSGNFIGISYVKWNYPPKGIEKIKAISYVKLKVSILISL